jgi:hypothetical protein
MSEYGYRDERLLRNIEDAKNVESLLRMRREIDRSNLHGGQKNFYLIIVERGIAKKLNGKR